MNLHTSIRRRKRPLLIPMLLAWLIFSFIHTHAVAIDSSAPNSTTSCTPSGCVARCNPTCAAGQVCILGTMSTCGVCPASQCVSQSVLGGSSSSAASPGASSEANGDNDNGGGSGGGGKGSLIGGLVGGLLGAGVVLSAAGYVGFRYKRKKNTLPFAYHGKLSMSQQPQQPPPPATGEHEVSNVLFGHGTQTHRSQPSTRQQVMSGVIPIAYIPPQSRTASASTNQTIEEQQQQYDNAVAQSHPVYKGRKSTEDNPFSDDHHSRNSVMTTDDERASIASSVQVATTPKATQAYQMMRAKPQIMRVNTVRVNNGLTRSGSTRTVLTRDSAQLSRSNTTPSRKQNDELQPQHDENRPSSAPTVPVEDDDPFHDRHSATDSEKRSRPQITDSMMSGPGDGEITIFWDGHNNRSNHSLSPAAFPMPPPSP
ncbi:hypothetical protein BJV82DRAFT_634506 [Fennellomyces sp. T-0311]|nr:hypothetical protein BJV82DRAFT_634506 [Fennellomyces sp. T-0311]